MESLTNARSFANVDRKVSLGSAGKISSRLTPSSY